MNNRLRKKQWKETYGEPRWDEWDESDELLTSVYTKAEFERHVMEIRKANRGHITICGRRVPCKKCGNDASGFYFQWTPDDRSTPLCKKCSRGRKPCTIENVKIARETAAFCEAVMANAVGQLMDKYVWMPLLEMIEADPPISRIEDD